MSLKKYAATLTKLRERMENDLEKLRETVERMEEQGKKTDKKQEELDALEDAIGSVESLEVELDE